MLALQSKISSNLSSVAAKIVQDYLAEGSKGNNSREGRRPDIIRVLGKQKRPPPQNAHAKPNAQDSSRIANVVSNANSRMVSPRSGQVINFPVAEGTASTAAVPPPVSALAPASGATTGQNGASPVPPLNTSAPLETAVKPSITPTNATHDGAHVVPFEALPETDMGHSRSPSARAIRDPSDPSVQWQNFIYEEAMIAADPALEKAANAVRCHGEPLNKVLKIVSENLSAVKNTLFDEIDTIIFTFLKDTLFGDFLESPFYSKYLHFMAMTEQVVGEDDFALFRVLGRGGFGMVSGCKRCYSGKLFAMKVMNKRRVKMKRAESLCRNERNILSSVDSPFVVCLKYAFTTPNDLYLVLDLMIGGDLGFHLQRKGAFTLKETKFYAARILLGIAALHDLSIVYRDLKPENILMDEHGYTKISDLGLACRVGRNGLTGTCGTRGYWAPEMLRRDAEGKRERYSLSVDWFSFGCCIYEFIAGVCPFRTEQARHWGGFPVVDKADKDKAIDLAIQEMEPELDSTFDEISKDFLRKLLHKDGRTRLGARGYREIIAHPWFAEIDFDNLNQVQPPMVPAKDINMATQAEIGSFSDDKQSRKVVLTDADHKQYENWQFTSIRAYQEEVVEFLLMEEILVWLA